MGHYAEFNIATGQIIRRGKCQSQHIPIPRRLNAIALVRVDYRYNAIICDEIDDRKIAVNPTFTKKSFDTHKPKPIKLQEDKKQAYVTNKQWQDVLKRLATLEDKNERRSFS